VGAATRPALPGHATVDSFDRACPVAVSLDLGMELASALHPFVAMNVVFHKPRGKLLIEAANGFSIGHVRHLN
jgi:hypothetical protein